MSITVTTIGILVALFLLVLGSGWYVCESEISALRKANIALRKQRDRLQKDLDDVLMECHRTHSGR